MSNEERIKQLERITARLARRSRKTAKAIITPYPISSCVTGEDVRGPVLHYMFSCTGVIAKGLIDIGTKLSEGATVKFYVSNKVHSVTKEYVMSRRTFLIEPGIAVDSGDKLIMSISPNGEEDKIREVWVSLLWIPDIADADIKQFLIGELDKIDVLEE